MTYASEVLADSPVLWWEFGESSGTVAADSSGNGRNGTYVGSPTLGAGGLIVGSGTAVDLDAVDDRITYSGTILSASTAAMSVEFWMQDAAAPGVSQFLANASGASAGFTFSISTAGTGSFNVNATGSGSGTVSTASLVGATHHVVVTYDSSTVIAYVDGVAVTPTATTTGTMNLTSLTVGAAIGGSQPFDGLLQHFAIYATVLSPSRISAHYTAGTTPPAPITIHPNKITSTGTVHAPAIVPYIPPPADGNINITAELTPATKHAACIEPDRSAQIEPARHVAGVNAT